MNKKNCKSIENPKAYLQQENKNLKERIAYLERSNNRRESTFLEQRKKISDLEDKVDKSIKYKEKQSRMHGFSMSIELETHFDNILDILNEVLYE